MSGLLVEKVGNTPKFSSYDIIIPLSILIGSKSAIAANFTPYITIPGLDPMTGATRHSRDTAAPPQTIMSPHVMFYDLLCPDMNSVLLVLVLEPGCGCQLSQLSRCLVWVMILFSHTITSH